MARLLEYARENGWPQMVARVIGGSHRRLRDALTARKVGCKGFRVGRHPRLLGLNHMTLGEGFSAGDDLWLEAITAYRETKFESKLVIGPGCSLSDRVHIACLSEVTIGENLLCGSGVLISDHGHGAYRGPEQSDPGVAPVMRPLYSAGPVVIGNNVWLGDAVMVLAGATIGDGCVIGAGSVVTGEVPAGTIAAGAPAKALRRWNASAREWERV